MHHPPRRSLLALALALLGCDRTPASLSIPAPARMLTSADGALCGRLAASLTFDRVDDLAPAPLDGVELTPKPGAACTWVLAEEASIASGEYDLEVRFETRDAPGQCAGPILAGMYVIRDLAFPFAEDFRGLGDGDFLSRPSDESDPRLAGEAVSFNADGDERDNLSELSVGSDPCHENSVPAVELEGVPAEVVEGASIPLVVRSSDPDGVPHRVLLTVRHANGAAFPPELVTFAGPTAGAPVSISPDPAARSWRESWDLTASADLDARAGAGLWNLTLVADEPFVGPLVVQAIADDGTGATLSGTEPASLRVDQDPAADPPLLLVEGAAAPVAALDFAEQSVPPASHRFTVVDANLASGVASLTTELGAHPDGVVLTHDGATSVLTWSPSNAQAVASATSTIVLALFDAAHAKKGEVLLEARIAPLVNDAPSIVEPRSQFLALPAQAFPSALVPFSISDPDEVDVPPRCEVVSVLPSGSTSCASPFDSATCSVSGARRGAEWPVTLTLVPGATYAACGAKPSFTASVRVEDTAPAGATNGALGDQATFALRTAEVVVPAVLTGGPAAGPDGVPDPHAMYIDGVAGRAIVAHLDSFSLVDLANTTAAYRKVFTRAEACVNGQFDPPRAYGAVDEIGHRVIAVGSFVDGTPSCDSGAVIFDLMAETTAPRDLEAACGAFTGGLGDVTNPAVDPTSGSFYLLCENTATRLVRFAAGDQQTIKTLTGFDAPFVQYGEADVALAPDGTPWFIAISNGDFFLVDLSTFDDATPTAMAVATPIDTRSIGEHAIDTERSAYLFTYEEGGQGYLGRLRLADRTVDTPLLLGPASGSPTIALRRPFAGRATAAPHLVASLGSDKEVVRVDLDLWQVVEREPAAGYAFGARSDRLWPSADRRYFMQPMFNYDPIGFFLHPFDGSESTFFPHAEFQSHVWVVETSRSGDVTLVAADKLVLLDFPEARQHVDQ